MIRVRKLPYYVRSVAALASELRPHSWPGALCPARAGPLELRNGLSFELADRLDLLILKEVVHDDAYRLRDLAGDEPRLIVDVGAGFGEFAVLAATTFPRSRVLAFEAHPQTFSLLEANVRRNGATNVEPHEVAVGTRPSYELSSKGWRARASTHADGPSFTLTGRRLAEFLSDERIDLLKIDCEGGELDVIESLGERGLRRVRRLVAEYHRHLVPDEDRLLQKVLTAHGFEVKIVPDPYDDAIGYVYARSAA